VWADIPVGPAIFSKTGRDWGAPCLTLFETWGFTPIFRSRHAPIHATLCNTAAPVRTEPTFHFRACAIVIT